MVITYLLACISTSILLLLGLVWPSNAMNVPSGASTSFVVCSKNVPQMMVTNPDSSVIMADGDCTSGNMMVDAKIVSVVNMT